MQTDKATEDFLYMLYRYLRVNPHCLVRVQEHDRVPSYKLLLGYYDEQYVYIRPSVILPLIHAAESDGRKVNICKIMEQLFAMDFIKVHWIVSCDCRYRPQKRVGKTKRRYITFYRNKLERYLREIDRRERH